MNPRDQQNAARLNFLKHAARVGFGALDRGEFKEFDSFDELEAYLKDLAERVIANTRR